MKVTQVRGTHPYTYRSGEWATLLGHVVVKGRQCMDVRFPDGARDQWPVFDPSEPYEFRTVKVNSWWTRWFFVCWNEPPTEGEPLLSGCMARSAHGHQAFGWKLRVSRKRAVSFGGPWVKDLPEDRLKRWRAS